jgi:hypothetical protein
MRGYRLFSHLDERHESVNSCHRHPQRKGGDVEIRLLACESNTTPILKMKVLDYPMKIDLMQLRSAKGGRIS